MRELFYGLFAAYIYLPFSSFSRKWKRIRRKKNKFLQEVTLPELSWKKCSRLRAIKVYEPEKANGNIRLSELAIINALATECEHGTNIFEVGTFDGRTSLNIAFSTPSDCKVYTLDLPPGEISKFSLASGERHMVDKPRSGARLEKYKNSHPHVVDKIHQLYGDSGTFDFSPFFNSCSLVFVDGSHSYDYAMADTASAKRLVKKGGVILWHDYGFWEGVTRALEEIEASEKMNLVNISGTSLVFWRNE